MAGAPTISRSSRFSCYVVFGAFLILIFVLAYCLSISWISVDGSTDICSGSRAADTLKFVAIISRHGNRGPLFDFKNNPYPANDPVHWPYGINQLTTYGRLQMYNLGVKIRSLYHGFLNTKYYNEDFDAVSTIKERALLSGEAFLAGLFPPTGFQVWNDDIMWQPIPLHTSSLEKTPMSTYCPQYEYELNITRERFEIQHADMLLSLNQHLCKYTKESDMCNSSNLHHVFRVWDTLVCEEGEGFALPSWSKSVFPEPTTKIASQLYIEESTGSETLTRLLIGSFFGELIETIRRKISEKLIPNRRIIYYSGHDKFLVALQYVLGVPKSSITGFVPAASAMIFELHQDPNTKAHSIQILYMDGSKPDIEPSPLKTIGSGLSFNFDYLVNITQRFCIVDFHNECKLNIHL